MGGSFAYNVLRSCTPKPLRRAYRTTLLIRRAAELARRTKRVDDVGEAFDALWEYDEFRPLQIRSEAVRLFEMVKRDRPKTVCEIGAAAGGTAFLFAAFAAPDATIVSVDLAFDDARRRAIRKFSRHKQRLHALAGDSHAAATRDAVIRLLGGRQIDYLLIDGDHSYDGVRLDFEQYAPLARPGGIVVLHDIVPSGFMRTGVFTGTDVGGVPTYWSELSPRFERTLELVDDPNQDGYGIGAVTWPGTDESSDRCS